MTSFQRLLQHEFQTPSRRFAVTTDDGVRLEGTRIGNPRVDRPAVVMAHGLLGWHRKPRFAGFADALATWFTPYAMDLRGHGASGGVCDYGGSEIHDVEAIVRLARRAGHERVVTLGISMGAIAVIRHGALIGGVDAVVAISSLASWDWHDGAHPRARENLRRSTATPAGRSLMRAWGVRLPADWEPPESPEEVVGKIAPTPIVIVHGEDDHLFGVEHALRLHDAAGEPRKLLLGDRFGHAEDGLTPAFAERLARVVFQIQGVQWSG